MKILVYCLQRSGSNYLETLLKKNFSNIKIIKVGEKRTHPAYKHFRLYNEKNIIPEPKYKNDLYFSSFSDFEHHLDDQERPDYYLVVSKNPFSWYKSYQDWARKCHWNKVNHHYIQEYNLFYGTWLKFSRESDKIIFVKYRDLLINKEQELKRLEEKLNLKTKISPFRLFTVKKVHHSGWFSDSRKKYYLNEDYYKQFSPTEMKELHLNLDIRVAEELGYSLQ